MDQSKFLALWNTVNNGKFGGLDKEDVVLWCSNILEHISKFSQKEWPEKERVMRVCEQLTEDEKVVIADWMR